ncbi:hypothetical protein [Motiliproteus sp. SC1-56]|uniref:bestrophin-like domain n=1 Tax=Motiliproteus sp. SC1-56 TaxID=2799565 RepID=UPI001A8D557B|nr:hypothetical protein [Motiliproteus sp. SC1-56]
MFQQFIDSIPILGIFLGFLIIALMAAELGYRIGHWWQQRTPDEKDGPTEMIVGAMLALMGFMLAISMGMASDRFDTRRSIVLEEAKSVGTAYLRAGFLPKAEAVKTRGLLTEYLTLRISTDDPGNVKYQKERSVEIQSELWSLAEASAREKPESYALGLYIDSLNTLIDLHEERVNAAFYARVPATILILLLTGSALTLAMVGYNGGLKGRRGSLTSIVMIVLLSSVITLVFDIDRPSGGFMEVSQRPLLNLQRQFEQQIGQQ